jgi:elongation factor Ts
MSLKRLKLVKANDNEMLTSYIHGEGAIGVIVKLCADKPEALDNADVKELAFNLCLHIAAFNPLYLDRSKVDQAWVKEQEEIFRAQMAQDESLRGKPEKVLGGILQGKVNKLLKESCMMDQGYVKEEKIPVSKAIEDVGKKAGAKLAVTDYVYFKVGQS